ncbi:Type II secretory pathway, ATPase PulE/Tfp pilus assembly pathway, ATPase PilB [hydrothermal vent metagenome]|uniref:Type II secretory pathway, ATPase PulE/Tfp pilus assembly pathway, ATPase PilB n=1 Tax=hydrothermal vent metagenome TaxID=652676 RepID=A0A3B1C018_9ZZZZ
MAHLKAHNIEPDRHLSLHQLMQMLVSDGRLNQHEVDSFVAPGRSTRMDIHPLVIIAERKWPDKQAADQVLTLDVLLQWLAHQSGLPFFRIDPLKVDVTAVTAVTSSAYASRHRILPVEVNQREVVIATAAPYVRSWETELAHVTGLEIKRVLASPLDINRYLDEFYSLSHSIQRATSGKGDNIPGISNLEQLVELGKSGRLDANDHDVVQIVDWLLQYAFDQRASDIHMEPRREKGNIRFRIDGVLHLVYEMPSPVMTAVSSRIKVLGRMDVVEKRRPQDGRIKTRMPDGHEIELRLSTMPTAFGEKLVLRIFDPDVLVKDFSALGFSERDIKSWKQMISQPHGIVLVTGPTGSGKTTSLYSSLRQIAQPEVNVCTVEDPIEMVEPRFNQMQVQQNIGLNFASGIRTLLRQDPDIIMVGEIRDLETAEMAIQAALTGHLVLSTLHTNDAASAIPRLREIGIPAYLINATLLGVMAQRLTRQLCPACKQPTTIDSDVWRSMTAPWKLNGEGTFFKAVGCEQCRNTGYRGRIGLYEMLKMTSNLRASIGPDSDAGAIRKVAIKDGMIQLRLSGAQKIAQGLTTVEEVMKVVPAETEL